MCLERSVLSSETKAGTFAPNGSADQVVTTAIPKKEHTIIDYSPVFHFSFRYCPVSSHSASASEISRII